MWGEHLPDDPETRDVRLKTLARLRRVDKQLAAWGELDAMELMPKACAHTLTSRGSIASN
jgi:hypothetical protein